MRESTLSIEIMAFDGIMDCFQRDDRWFCGVVVINGSGSLRDGLDRHYSVWRVLDEA